MTSIVQTSRTHLAGPTPPTTGTPAAAGPVRPAPSWWASARTRRATARRLREADLRAARLAELHHMRAVLREARETVERGWVQGAWLRVGGTDGRTHVVTSGALDLVDPRVVTGACLVGALVQAGAQARSAHASGPGPRGPSPLSDQLVRRTLDAVWQTLCAHEVRPGRACAPAVLRARVRDLTRWNDAPGRTAGEVRALLARAEDRVRTAAGATTTA